MRRRKRGEEKKAIVALLVFIIATLEFLAEKNCSTQKVHWGITLSRIPLDVNFQKLTCKITRTLLHQTRMNQTLEGNTKH